MINKALKIAHRAHLGQVDKGGVPYILHPIRVALHCETDAEKVVALLHDVVEDTSFTLEDLKAEGISRNLLDAIDSLTNREGESYDEFICRVSQNELAVRVKIQDLKDNMDLSRMGGKKHRKYDLYCEALSYLKSLLQE